MDCSVASSSLMSCRFAPSSAIPMGNPCDSTARLRFVPFFSPVGGIVPYRFSRQGRFYHAAVHALPFPPYPFQKVIGDKPFLPHPPENPRRRPFAEIAMDAAGRPVCFWQRFPLDARPQHIKYTFQYLPRRYRFPSGSRLSCIGLVLVPFPLRHEVLHSLPQFFGQFP